jgi:hypothetical protein
MLLSWQQLRFGAGGLAFQVGAIFRMLNSKDGLRVGGLRFFHQAHKIVRGSSGFRWCVRAPTPAGEKVS